MNYWESWVWKTQCCLSDSTELFSCSFVFISTLVDWIFEIQPTSFSHRVLRTRLCLKPSEVHQWEVTLPLMTSSWRVATVQVNRLSSTHLKRHFNTIAEKNLQIFLYRSGEESHRGNNQWHPVGGSRAAACDALEVISLHMTDTRLMLSHWAGVDVFGTRGVRLYAAGA